MSWEQESSLITGMDILPELQKIQCQLPLNSLSLFNEADTMSISLVS